MNYIQLFNKITGESESFVTIDKKLRYALNVSYSEKRYFAAWYDAIEHSYCDSIEAVMEKTEDWHDDNLARALTWLNEHYTLDAWYSR